MYLRLIMVVLLAFISMGSLAKGFDENYEVLQGDFDGDGDIDLYVRQKPQVILLHGDIITPIVIPPNVDEFVLEHHSSSGAFTIMSNLSGVDLSIAQKSTVIIQVGDFNADGFVDLIASGIGNIISGAFDQIVFADSLPNVPPFHLTEVDSQFQRFFDEVRGWILNPNYFHDNAPTVTVPVPVDDTIFMAEWCASPAWVSENGSLESLPPIPTIVEDTLDDIYVRESEFVVSCNSTGRTVIHYDFVSVQYQIPIGSKDYSVFNQNAIEFSNAVGNIENLVQLEPESETAVKMAAIFEEVLGVSIYRGILTAGTPSFEGVVGASEVILPAETGVLEGIAGRIIAVLRTAGVAVGSTAGGVIVGVLFPTEIGDGTLSEEDEKAFREEQQRLLALALAVVREKSTNNEYVTFYRGTSSLQALEIVEFQRFDAERILRDQLDVGAVKGIFISTQLSTAESFANVSFGDGRRGGPEVVRIDVDVAELEALLNRRPFLLETPIDRPLALGQTETIVPFDVADEFSSISVFTYAN